MNSIKNISSLEEFVKEVKRLFKKLNKKIVYENATKFVFATCWGCAKQVTAPDLESLCLKLQELGWGMHNDSLRCGSCIEKL